MNADVEVMADLGGPLTRKLSDRKLQRFATTFEEHKFTRWVIEGPDGEFLGYAGVAPVDNEHPLGAHHEIGWRLVRKAWGNGYATEAAEAALSDAFDRVGLSTVLAYTAADNHRSQMVMQRLGLRRDTSSDFTTDYENYGSWSGMVWIATRDDRRGSISPGSS